MLRRTDPEALQAIRVWDLPTRTFHVGLVGLFNACWWTYASDHMAWRRACGFGAVGLLTFRLYWGFVGSSAARFQNFLGGPPQVWNYLRGRVQTVVGHNPLGGWSVAALIGLSAAQVVSGLFTGDRDDPAHGPFAAWLGDAAARSVQEIHVLTFDALLGLVAMHVAAIFAHRLMGDDLVWPMLHGRKRLPAGAARPRFAPWWRALLGAVAAIAVVGGLWSLGAP